jgi:hypothetical protein
MFTVSRLESTLVDPCASVDFKELVLLGELEGLREMRLLRCTKEKAGAGLSHSIHSFTYDKL